MTGDSSQQPWSSGSWAGQTYWPEVSTCVSSGAVVTVPGLGVKLAEAKTSRSGTLMRGEWSLGYIWAPRCGAVLLKEDTLTPNAVYNNGGLVPPRG